ncbi:SsrA-binding protein [Chlamydiales bacterium STE3]|nr:SsrA-binding protein [Chlamydiales bacterium STE3]
MSKSNPELVSNKKASFNYDILETLEAGLVLKGTEIKSLRDHGGNLQDAWIRVEGTEAWLVASSIAPYRFGNIYNHEERRERKLLLHKRELNQLHSAQQGKGYSLIPLSLYLKNGRVKAKIAIAKGKKTFDKRQSIQDREEKRHLDRARKQSFE